MRTNKPKTMLIVVQEGGSAVELYAHAFDTRRDATRFTRSCAKAAYRTTEPIEVPAGTDMGALQRVLSAVGSDLA